jgi:exosortase F-associated protein
MTKGFRIVLILVLVFILIGIRAFLEPYFYDPLIAYFKNDSLLKPLPDLSYSNYFFNIFLRYSLNSLISIAIIYLIFQNIQTLKFTIKFYIFSFFTLCFLLFIFLLFENISNNLILFYLRRFLIQPLFLFILLPAFYYQKLQITRE